MSKDTQLPPSAETSNQQTDTHPRSASRHYVRTLLIVVIVLGVLLLAGAAVVIGTIVKRVFSTQAAPTRPDFGTIELMVPTGAQLVSVENGAVRVVLRLRDTHGPLLIFLDPKNGEETGRIRLIAE